MIINSWCDDDNGLQENKVDVDEESAVYPADLCNINRNSNIIDYCHTISDIFDAKAKMKHTSRLQFKSAIEANTKVTHLIPKIILKSIRQVIMRTWLVVTVLLAVLASPMFDSNLNIGRIRR